MINVSELLNQDVVEAIASYLGIVESMDSNINRLMESEYKAGMTALEQAMNSEKERESLLREARNRFNKSIHLEKKNRLALSLAGLALCHQQLGDQKNADYVLRKITEIPTGGLLSIFGSDQKILEMQDGVYTYFGERSPQFVSSKYEEMHTRYLSEIDMRIQSIQLLKGISRNLINQLQQARMNLEKKFEEESLAIQSQIKQDLGTIKISLEQRIQNVMHEALGSVIFRKSLKNRSLRC